MAQRSHEYIYARATLALAGAARTLGVALDLDRLAPTLRDHGQVELVPADEHLAVARAIYEDPRETLGIEVAQVLPRWRSPGYGASCFARATPSATCCGGPSATCVSSIGTPNSFWRMQDGRPP
jgi:hypothetical protein